MQCAVIEFARGPLNLERANSTEFDADTPHPVICLLEEQERVTHKGGTMRLGAHPCRLKSGSLVEQCYPSSDVSERHRHRFEFNPKYRTQFEESGMLATGTSPDDALVEIVEVRDHPWFVAVQFHPEFQSTPARPHPLFREFVAAACKQRQGNRAIAQQQ